MSNGNVVGQSINVTIGNLLNVNYVVNYTYFRLFTYFSADNDLVGIATYTGNLALQTGNI